MPGSNTSGTSNTAHYLLGRGVIQLSLIDPITGNAVGGFRDIGNASSFSLTNESEKLEHQSSRGGLRVTDKEVELSRKVNFSITTDELNDENMALFFSGGQLVITNPATAGFTEWTIVPASPGVSLARWYPLTNSAGVRAMGILKANLNLKNATTNTSLVEGTDFEVDEALGLVFIKPVPTNITAGVGLKATLTAQAGSKNIDEVRMLTTTNQPYMLRFVGQNPADGNRAYEVVLYKITPKGEGDFGLISDEWATMQITGVAEANSAFNAASPYGHIRSVKL